MPYYIKVKNHDGDTLHTSGGWKISYVMYNEFGPYANFSEVLDVVSTYDTPFEVEVIDRE